MVPVASAAAAAGWGRRLWLQTGRVPSGPPFGLSVAADVYLTASHGQRLAVG